MVFWWFSLSAAPLAYRTPETLYPYLPRNIQKPSVVGVVALGPSCGAWVGISSRSVNLERNSEGLLSVGVVAH